MSEKYDRMATFDVVCPNKECQESTTIIESTPELPANFCQVCGTKLVSINNSEERSYSNIVRDGMTE